ncbi:MAG: ABC-F family ATP-binding cassette domain-containing protein [Lachnospiraceae bacterium]|nr:ABC-F family ATP-binding cassette domain-containing protein [Lachnospiraceae bacterium]
MNILTAENLTKAYTDKPLFKNVSFIIDETDKIGIIGVNGTGKSTLLKMLAGLEVPDSGEIKLIGNLKVSYLPQSPEFDAGKSVINQVFNSDDPLLTIIKEYEELTSRTENIDTDRLSFLAEKIERANAWGIETDAKTILTKLGINNFDADVSTLSGGQRKRVAMAGALISKPDLLIMDEPTNHIDNDTVLWLEKYLMKYNKALVLITHDRYFLERVTNKIFEIDRQSIYTYESNYSLFLELREQREETLFANERKRQNFLRTELEWVRRGAQARSTKQKARLQRFEEVSSLVAPEKASNLEINTLGSRMGRKTIEIENISKAYSNNKLIDNFSYILHRDDRVGIIGPNGCGKSTLLKIIMDIIKPDSGSVVIGDTVKIGYFSQESEELDDSIRVIDFIRETADFIDTVDGKVSASKMLEYFLFTPDMQWTYIGKLSGGEKQRLKLLNVLMGAPNILILDEPTNDLDIVTLSVLESYLETFKGAVICVSHDRYFLDKTVDRIFAFEGRGVIKRYEGNYSDYAEKHTEEEKHAAAEAVKPITTRPEKQPKLKMTFAETKEFETIDADLEKAEELIAELDKKIGSAGSDYVLLQQLTADKEAAEAEYERLTERWVYLTELDERIKNSKNN